MTRIVKRVFVPYFAFKDREEAARELAAVAVAGKDPGAIVLAVPRGGAQIGARLAEALGCPLALAMVRKLPIPNSPEAGFGAVAVDGTMVLNERLVKELRLPGPLIERIRDEVLDEVRRRAGIYRECAEPAAIAGRRVVLADDGLASGYTMVAAARMARRAGAEEIVLCVPVSPLDSIELLEPRVDDVYCLIAQESPPFAVAAYYRRFPDLTDAEVREILQRARGEPAPKR